MRKLMDGNSGSRRSLLTEIFAINFIVTREIGHVHQEAGNFNNVLQFCADACEDVANVFDDGSSLLTDIELEGGVSVDPGAGDRIIRTARARAGDEQVIAC